MIDGKCETKRMKLSELNPAPYNPRVITDAAFDGLSHSIDRFGLLSLIVWNKRSGNIVGGHQRYRKLAEAGETETDVVVVDLDDNEEVALNVVLNSREIRGDFTKEVMHLLSQTEVQIGSAFNDLQLNELHRKLSRVRWEKPEKRDKPDKPDEPPAPPMDTQFDPDPEVEGADEAVIVCPKCSSMWQMTDNKVIFNAKELKSGIVPVEDSDSEDESGDPL